MKNWMLAVFSLLLAGCAGAPAWVATPHVIVPATRVSPSLIPPTLTLAPARTILPVLTATPASPVDTPVPLPVLRAGQPVTITQLYQMNASFGWGLEPAGHLLRTANEGETWRDVSPPAGSIFGPGFFPLTAKTAWVVPV